MIIPDTTKKIHPLQFFTVQPLNKQPNNNTCDEE